MNTYQDLLEINKSGVEADRMKFVLAAVSAHKSTSDYATAVAAEEYYREKNPTIMAYERFVRNSLGKKVKAFWKANHKIASNWYFYFTTQAVEHLLGNGVQFKDKNTKEKLGKNFDQQIQRLATFAKNGSVGFGFFNFDHIDVFSYKEFVPLYDEEDGALKAGIRFWQIDDTKPFRATLYEIDGVTEYIKRKDEDMQVFKEKQSYTKRVLTSKATGTEIFDGENYPGFPIVPLYNINKQSDLVGKRNTIDAYDLIASGLVNNVSEGDLIYWILKNFGGMDATDDARFIEQLHLTGVAHVDDGDEGSEVKSEKIEAPYLSSKETLLVLRDQLYKDFMGVDVEKLAAGNVTATQIRAAYDPLNQKSDLFEACVTEFIHGILELAGIDDEPHYVRTSVANVSEEIQTLLTAGQYLDEETIVKRVCALLGMPDEAEVVLKRKSADDMARFSTVVDNPVD